MPINPLIPLQAGSAIVNPAPALRGLSDKLQAQQEREEDIEMQRELLDLRKSGIEQQKLKDEFQMQDMKTQRRLRNNAIDAYRLKNILESGGPEAAMGFIERNRQRNDSAGYDSNDTDYVASLIESGDMDTLNTVLENNIFMGEALGLIETDGEKSEKPSTVREWEYYSSLKPEEQNRFLEMKRSNKFLDIGSEFVSPRTGERLVKGIAPEKQPEFLAEQETAKESAKQFESAKGKWQASESKLINSISTAKDRSTIIDSTIDKAKSLLSEFTTSYGASLANLPATEAKRLSNLLDTIRANVGFSELQSLRDNSPTGGALGQVSEMENRLLQSVLGSLDQAGDMNDLAGVLDTISAQRKSAIQRMEAAYEMDKSKYGTSIKQEEKTPDDMSSITDEEIKERLGL